MALPAINTPWPPPHLDPIDHKYRQWSAWLSGDPEQLAWVYRDYGSGSTVGRSFFRTTGEAGTQFSGQYRGAAPGAHTRTFWGQNVPAGELRTKLHVPLAGDIAAMSSDLLFAKRAVFDLPDGQGNDATRTWLDELFDDTMHATLLEAGEICAGMSGVYLRVVYDTAIADKPWLSVAHPDSAVPEFTHGILTSVTFWRVLVDTGETVVRHLEQHVPAEGAIYHGVYEGTQGDLGLPVSMLDYPQTAPIAGLLTDGERIVLPDLPRGAATVAYIPNVRPNRIWRGLVDAAPLGRSDFSGIEGLMDALDETYSSWMRDIRLAKSRLMMPPSYLENIGPGKGAVADVDREVFVPLAMLASNDGAPMITANQFQIRWREFKETCEQLIGEAVTRAGYSAQTFGEAATTAMTATEVESRERRTLLTRAKKLNYWRPGVASAVFGLMAIEASVFGRRDLTLIKPDVTFPDAVLPSTSELAATAVALNTAQAASKETLVAMVHPDWSADQVAEEVQAIKDELGMELFARARVTLANPSTLAENVGQQVDDLAGTITDPKDSDLVTKAAAAGITV